MPPRDAVYLLHMLQAARLVLSFVEGIDAAALQADIMRQSAVIRQIEVIGEAARHVSAEFRAAHPAIPWSKIIAMRNELIHAYHRVALDVVWHVVTEDIPTLIAQLEPLVPPEE